ncbi:MAG: hypothetical protein M1825_005684 [Sarcosagium campestre]|nr:MAG: hypothetical protein M1825_005684 [Sarcosagium campestre]
MPPFVARKRSRSVTPPYSQSARPKDISQHRRRTLFEDVDTTLPTGRTLEANKAFLESLENDSTDSSLSDVSSDEFEDVRLSPPSKRQKVDSQKEEDGVADEDIDWEDAIMPDAPASELQIRGPQGDLELTLGKTTNVPLNDPHGAKKGPSKIERQIRMYTHCMHVQYLMFHNHVRNRWLCDRKVQNVLLAHLTPGIQKEIERWRTACGWKVSKELSTTQKGYAARGKKLKKAKTQSSASRDWGGRAKRVEKGVPDLSHGDPTLRLMKALAAFWRKRFRITAPGLRKRGYMPLSKLEQEVSSFQNRPHDAEDHGERIKDIDEFRQLASRCEGSRDVGAQLFTALARALGLDARMIASLQPVGFGWSKIEEASEKRRRRIHRRLNDTTGDSANDGREDEEEEEDRSEVSRNGTGRSSIQGSSIAGRGKRRRTEAPAASAHGDESDASVIDVTPNPAKQQPSLPFDKDLPFPIYWTEIISPITHQCIPVDAIVLNTVATTADSFSTFEPRGAKADKAKQVLAYVVAFSPDRTAKDVTVRYLKRHIWPGKTKGVRMPVEKLPVYNHRGKIKRYEDADWFKRVMSGYSKEDKYRTVADDIEDEKDLTPVKVVREVKQSGETLQGYKNSAEFVLERHLRREEALLPGTTHVKTFTTGKGDKASEEKVYRREDVVSCKTSESWHKEGREVKAGEQPLKLVPIRAVTLTRKREIEQAEAEGGGKAKQGLYSKEQTAWIIPPPIQDGIIPRNAYGNIDCFVPSMVPRGAVHLPHRGLVKVCKRLEINFAEAVTGFEFGAQRAVPVVEGVVIPEEAEKAVLEAWKIDEEERVIKEEGKREKLALATWRKFLMGLRILERVKEEYGNAGDGNVLDEVNPFTNRNKPKATKTDSRRASLPGSDPARQEFVEQMPGGFIVEDDASSDNGWFCAPDSAEANNLMQQQEPTEHDARSAHDDESPSDVDQSHTPFSAPSSLKDRRSETSPNPDTEDASVNMKTMSGKKKDRTPKMTKSNSLKSKARLKSDKIDRRQLSRSARTRQWNEDSSSSDTGSNSDDANSTQDESESDYQINSVKPSGGTISSQRPDPTRSLPKRRSARASTKAVRSQYFDQISDDDSDNNSDID